MMLKRTAALAATAALSLTALAGCGLGSLATGASANNAPMFDALAKRKREKGGTWTILIHMGAENNLYRFGLEDRAELVKGLAGVDGVQALVLFDGIKDGDSTVYLIDKNGEKEVGAPFIPASHEIDSGDVKVASDFVTWAAKAYPADHTFLGYWDHGSGLFQDGKSTITRGFVWDDKGSHMTTADLGTVTGAFKKAAGKNLAVVAFDACLMAHAEIAYQARNSTDYLVASEELEPGKGWDYTGWGKTLAASDRTPAAVASALVDSYGASYAPGGSQTSGRDDTTLSATDIAALSANLVPALNAFADVAAAKGGEKPNLQAARATAQTFYNKDCADIGSYFKNLSAKTTDADVKAASDRVLAALKTTVVRETHSSKYAGATGLVLYFPTPTQRINAAYGDSKQFAFAETKWGSFLANYR